jgi:hypothetical protein
VETSTENLFSSKALKIKSKLDISLKSTSKSFQTSFEACKISKSLHFFHKSLLKLFSFLRTCRTEEAFLKRVFFTKIATFETLNIFKGASKASYG